MVIKCWVVQADMRPLLHVSCLPNLTGFQFIEVSMSVKAATQFARLIGGVKLPGLRTIRVQIEPPMGPFDGTDGEVSGRVRWLFVIVENLPELPSLQV